jgi:hypothetical protein
MSPLRAADVLIRSLKSLTGWNATAPIIRAARAQCGGRSYFEEAAPLSLCSRAILQSGIAGIGNTVEGALRAFDLQYLRVLQPPPRKVKR